MILFARGQRAQQMNIVLIGYRGSGKTTVGKMLASRLGRGFVDTDESVVQRAGKSIKDIFELNGEEHFRHLESLAIRDALTTENLVIALGGGAIKRESNRDAIIKFAPSRIYLRCDPEELYRRIHADPATAANRPSLTHLGGGIDEIRQLLSQREPMYHAVMTHEINVTQLTAEQAADRIIELL
jgi:shikimate kinase